MRKALRKIQDRQDEEIVQRGTWLANATTLHEDEEFKDHCIPVKALSNSTISKTSSGMTMTYTSSSNLGSEESLLRGTTLGNTTALPEHEEVNDIYIPVKAISNSIISKGSSGMTMTDRNSWSSCSSAPWGFEKPDSQDIDRAFSNFKPEKFQVTKINKWMKEQERTLYMSEKGIENIRPSGKVSSREKWGDLLLCYKIDECTLVLKYTNVQRTYRAKSKKKAEIIFSYLRQRVNAHQKLRRKMLQKDMVEGVDEKERYVPVPTPRVEKYKHPNEDQIRIIVDEILWMKNSKIYRLKESICNFTLRGLQEVKELRMYLNQFKDKILDECKSVFPAEIDIENPDVHNCTLKVIESVIESACLPSHLEEINKILNQESRTSHDVARKFWLLREKPQKFYGIERKMRSKGDWLSAVIELENFPKKLLPSEKMQCLLNTAKSIHQEARNYKKEITGDDLLPIVIFVLVKAYCREKKIIITAAEQLFVDILIDPDALQGEGGYYLCVFSAALEFIRNYDAKKIEERFTTIQRLKDFGFF